MNDLYANVLNSSIKTLLDKSDSIKDLEHAGIKGNIREKFVIDFIKPYLNKSIEITTGTIIDSYNNQSKQIDCIIYNPSIIPPAFLNNAAGIIPYESVLATIEIKSILTVEEIQKSIINAISVKKLKMNLSDEIGGTKEPRSTPLCCFFAYMSDCKEKDEYDRYNEVFDNMKRKKENENIFLPISLGCIARRSSFFCTNAKDIYNQVFNTVVANEMHDEIKAFLIYLIGACNIFSAQRGQLFIGNYLQQQLEQE